MATKKVNVSTDRFTYGFGDAQFPDLDCAKRMAKKRYNELKELYGDELQETFDQALVMEETSVYLQLTRVIK